MSDLGYTDYEAVIRVFDNMKLSSSGYSPDAVSAMLRDTTSNTLETHAPIFLTGEADEGLKKVAQALKDLPPGSKVILLAGAVVVVSGVAVVSRNWDTIRAWSVGTFNKLRSKKAVVERQIERDMVEVHVEGSASTALDFSEPSKGIEVSSDPASIKLSVEQWRNLLQSALTLSTWEDQVWQLLANAIIDDGDGMVLEWQRQMRSLDPESASAHVRKLLEGHPDLRDDAAVAELMRVLVQRSSAAGEETTAIDC